jgi:hypothetical protein
VTAALVSAVRARLARAVRSSLDCGFYVNDGTLRTEIVLPNPAVGPLAERLGGKLAVLTFHSPQGRVVRRRAVAVRRGRTRVVDTSRLRGLDGFGQVRVRSLFKTGQARGGNRSIFHCYYPGGMTLVHEKKEPAPPRDAPRGASLRPGQGYMTLFGVPADGPLDLHLVALSQDRIDAEVRLVRFDAAGGRRTSPPLRVPARGAAFVGLRTWLADCPEILAGPIAVDATAYALSYYYFVHNREDGTWQAQHL